jgi:putative ABC transport system permease protein
MPLFRRIWNGFRPARRDRELEEELDFHREMIRNKFRDRGLNEEQAELDAKKRLGNLSVVREDVRDTHRVSWLAAALQDLRHGVVLFRRDAGISALIIAVLALGIGINTGVFSLVNAVILKPLDLPGAERAVRFRQTFEGGTYDGGPAAMVDLWRRQTGLFEEVSAGRLELMNLAGTRDPAQLNVARVTADFFRLFQAPIAVGRTFTAEEEAGQTGRVTVLSHALWVKRFGSDADIVGRQVVLSGTAYEVVGVVGSGFDSEQFDPPPDIWVPFELGARSMDGCYCQVNGRLRPGVSIGVARAQLEILADQYHREFPSLSSQNYGFTVLPLQQAMTGNIRSSLLVLLGAVTLVLLIACANVANLSLVRAVGRRREIGVRCALGAGRGRIVRQLLTESVLLSSIGGALGLALGTAGMRVLLALYAGSVPFFVGSSASNIPRIGVDGSMVTPDWRVVVFTMLLSLGTGIVFGLIPAFQAPLMDLSTTLKQSGGRSGSGLHQDKARSLLVTLEIALALVLLIGAALLIRTSIALRNVDPGFDSHNVLAMQMSLSGTRFEKSAEAGQLVREGIRAVHLVPGVEAVAASCCVPLETVWQSSFEVIGRPLTGKFHGLAGWTFITPEYFDAFRIPVRRGRAFDERDTAGSPSVVLINEAMARRYWPDGDPLNARLKIGRAIRPEFDADPPRHIVGIVSDTRDVRLDGNPRPAMYVPAAQLPDALNELNYRLLPIAWIVRTRVEPHMLVPAIQEELRKATGLPVTRIRSMEEVAVQSTIRGRLNALLMTIFGGSALLLASIGIYGLMAYSVQQRTQEIGIRLALGAESRQVRNMVVKQGLSLTLIGVVVGIAASFGLTRLLESSLYQVKAWDPPVFIGVPLILGAVSLVSVWLPARRATRIDPTIALRHE